LLAAYDFSGVRRIVDIGRESLLRDDCSSSNPRSSPGQASALQLLGQLLITRVSRAELFGG